MVWFLPVFLKEQTFDEANESKHSAIVHVTMCLSVYTDDTLNF